ncbi:MAG: class I SAM-dependent methyltransferase [Melioribacteraceae bacterium]|nr:MAG: class I SAM-dependent methyltransferase [Melioribacteraceae bacterium]
MNPWLEIKLNDYESHMALSSIRQAQYLSGVFAQAVQKYSVKSVAILGCAGGNGLEIISNSNIDRVVCVDINPAYIGVAKERFSSKFRQGEFLCADILSSSFSFKPVDLIFAGLIFEYVDYNIALANISKVINQSGKLVAVLQLPSESISEISPSQYTSLNKLSEIFNFVSPNGFQEAAKLHQFEIIESKRITLESGKSFQEMIFEK